MDKQEMEIWNIGCPSWECESKGRFRMVVLHQIVEKQGKILSRPQVLQLRRVLRAGWGRFGSNSDNKSRDFKLKKVKSTSGSASNSCSFTNTKFQRKRSITSYKMYGVEGKVKGSFRKCFRWLKDQYSPVVYGWW